MEEMIFNKIVNEKRFPCISIIIPTYKKSRARMTNSARLKKSISAVLSYLDSGKISNDVKQDLINKILKVEGSVDFLHSMNGVGIFISGNVFEIVYFPFPVTEKIIVESSFETRDLFYMKQYLTPYYVLVLDKKLVNLYVAKGNDIRQINNHYFPMSCLEEIEDESPVLTKFSSGTLRSVRGDKTMINRNRLEGFYKKVDFHLQNSSYGNNSKIILAGTTELIRSYLKISKIKHRIINALSGSFSKQLQDLKEKAFLSFVTYQNEYHDKLIKELIEFRNLRIGVEDTWKVVNDGNVKRLILEKDYQEVAYIKKDDFVLHLEPPVGKYIRMPDIVDEIIELVYDRQGEILFVENNKLLAYSRILAIPKY